MIEFGKTLREAREAKGLSISQVADMTRIMHSIVEGLEKENFSGIPAPIYGRGFVKLYCEAVGLDPKVMVAEFMEIYTGNRDVAIKERPRTPPPPVSETPVAEEPPAAAQDILAQESVPAPDTQPEFSPEAMEPQPAHQDFQEPEPSAEPDLFSLSSAPAQESAIPAEKPSQNLSRYATPVRQRPESHISPMIGRWAALALGATVVLVLVSIGLRALYRATSPNPSAIDNATPKAAAAVVAAEKQEAAKPKIETQSRKERIPQDIPSLYID